MTEKGTTSTTTLAEQHPEGGVLQNLPPKSEEEEAADDSETSSVASFENTDKSKSEDKTNSTTEEEEREKLTQRETKNVFRLRLLVLLVLLLASVAVCCVVYLTTSGGETDEFKSQYEGNAAKLLETFQNIATEKLDAVNSLGVAVTSHGVDYSASDEGSSWPFMTISNFQQRAVSARKQSGVLFTGVVPRVEYEQRDAWENYTQNDPYDWIQSGLDFQDKWDPFTLQVSLPAFPDDVHPGYIQIDDYERGFIRDDGYGPFFPIWQTSPVLKGLVNFNLGSLPQWLFEIEAAMRDQSVVIGRMLTPPAGTAVRGGYLTKFFGTLLNIQKSRPTDYLGDPFSYVFFPIFDKFGADKEAVAVMFTAVHWASYFENLMPETVRGMTVVFDNGCDGAHTYTIHGSECRYEGVGDLHERRFSQYERTASFADLNFTGHDLSADGSINENTVTFTLHESECPISIRVYPNKVFYSDYKTAEPIFITAVVAFIFCFTVLMFVIYDRLVERRQHIILRKATNSNAILSSLFPKNIRDALMADAERKENHRKRKSSFTAPNHALKSFLNGDEEANEEIGEETTLADLFPYTTVFFADIAGFTAWSSTRDPQAVFILLQNLYQAFDRLAKRRRVFKVETIGDSYVAVTGLPSPQADHAVIMARFAAGCQELMKEITIKLQPRLGPGTDDLALRIGLHSGAVTAGVLQGDRARFQLFGDTVNTAARMESTGVKNRIQVSQTTASLLIEAGKSHWVRKREEEVNAKGKGVLSTYFLTVSTKQGKGSSASGSSGMSVGDSEEPVDCSTSTGANAGETLAKDNLRQQDRLVDWVVELVSQYLKKIVAQRSAKKTPRNRNVESLVFTAQGSHMDEVKEVIALPKFDAATASKAKDHREITLDAAVAQQLKSWVTGVASTYRDNPFHNFEHACHVTMAVHKFLQRIVAPDLNLEDIERTKTGQFASQLHDYTHGINSDPIALAAIVFSAIIHDSDHRGVSNVQLGKEDEEMAARYENKSIAEQNSLDLGWNMLMAEEYKDLRKCLFTNETEFKRFRQVLVNVVLATDIFDKELNGLRKARWEKAFATNSVDKADTSIQDALDHNGLRATIVIEHIIQASDVSHTMQHWHVYRKWNKRLFQELSEAYKNGRMGADPAGFWYHGELGFFDNYIIPLAKKLKECNVFGVSSDECLNYALQNREEWKSRGEAIVREMIQEFGQEEGVKS